LKATLTMIWKDGVTTKTKRINFRGKGQKTLLKVCKGGNKHTQKFKPNQPR
jgi:hypothetical protein